MHIDRRRSPRIELVAWLEGRSLGPGQPLHVREISLGGMAFETHTPFDVGGVHAFRLTLGDESTTELSGRVMHCRMATASPAEPLYVVGVQFVDDDDDGASVEEVIRRVR